MAKRTISESALTRAGRRQEVHLVPELQAELAVARGAIEMLHHRLDAAIDALRLEQQVEDFDCPHDAEARCRCGEVNERLIERARAARVAVLATGGR